MSKIISIGRTMVSSDNIVAIRPYEEDNREFIQKKGELGFPMCLFKRDVWDGLPVYHDYFGGRYVIRGERKCMMVYLSNEKTIDTRYDESIIEQWKKAKEGKPSV